MAAANATLSKLDLFLAEAKKKNFPFHYTFMDCALRVYGIFVVWLHFVMYLIFKYIYRDIDISLGRDDDQTTEIASEIVVTEVPEIEASDKPRHLIDVSTQFKKSSKKKQKYVKMSEKELSESDRIVKSEKTQENEDEEHLQLMRKFLAQNDVSQPEKPFTVQDLPLWIALMDHTDDDKPTSELRLKMADWLLRRGGMDQLPKGISPVPLSTSSTVHDHILICTFATMSRVARVGMNWWNSRLPGVIQCADQENPLENLKTAKNSVYQPRSFENGRVSKAGEAESLRDSKGKKGGEEVQYTRAPKGEQVDKLAAMERFLEKLDSKEHVSGSADSLEQVPLVTKVGSTKTAPQTKKSPKRAEAGRGMKEDDTQISTMEI